MYAIRRITAYVLAMGLVLTPLQFLVVPAETFLFEALPSFWEVCAGFLAFLLSAGVPVLLIGACVGVMGWTPGKLVISSA